MLKTYLKALFRFSGSKAWHLIGLMLVLGLTQGIGLAMIIPFLHIIGIEVAGSESRYAKMFELVAGHLGVTPGLFTVTLAYIIIIFLYAMANRSKEILSATLSSGFTCHLRNSLYEHFCHANWISFLKVRDADIIHALTHDTQRVAFATQQLFQLVVSGVLVAIYIVFSMSISISMTCAALFCGGILLLVLYPLNRNVVRFGFTFRNANNEMYKLITEHIGGMKIAKSYDLEKYHRAEFFRASDLTSDQTVRFTRINTTTRLGYQVGAAVAIAFFITVGIKVFHLSAVNLMVIVFLFSRILPGLSNLQQIFQRIANAMPSFQALLDMETALVNKMDYEYEPTSSDSFSFTMASGISFNRVWFRYDKTLDRWSLKDIQLIIPVNKTTAVIGPSGAGKTTLADMLLGLLLPERGELCIDDTVLDRLGQQEWIKCIGYVPQETYLFHESIRDNLEKAKPGAAESELWEALEKASAKSFVSQLHQGLDTIVGDRGIRLSGGERQRLALARALLRSPAVLVLDEATSSLDEENETHIQRALEKLKGNLTIVVIAHRGVNVENADQVIRMANGRIISIEG